MVTAARCRTAPQLNAFGVNEP